MSYTGNFQKFEDTSAAWNLQARWDALPRDERFTHYDAMRTAKEAAGLSSWDAMEVTLRQMEEDAKSEGDN